MVALAAVDKLEFQALRDDLAVVAEHRVPVVLTSLGAAAEVVEVVHGYGGVVFHDVTNARHARKASCPGASTAW